MNNKKTVLIPIIIPEGEFCWDYKDRICDFFDNEGGCNRCTISSLIRGNSYIERDKNNMLKKTDACKKLMVKA